MKPFDASKWRHALALVSFILMLPSVLSSPASAQERLTVEQGKSILLPVGDNVDTVFVSDTTVADASISSNNRVFVFGKEVGETSLIATSTYADSDMTFTVVVTHKLSEIRSVIQSRFPGEQIAVESSRGSLMITGIVSSDRVRETLVTTLESAAPETTIIDRLRVASSNIIRLEVKLLEVSRTQVENFGIDWNATVTANGFFLGTSNRGVLSVGKSDTAESSLNAALDVLISNGIATIAQETVLSTVNGEEALFSVGGEIPIPTFIPVDSGSSDGNFQLDFKFIGTSLSFTPSIAPGNKLRLLIDSTISSQGQTSSTVNGNVFPNLNTRSFRTNVELSDRQPFVIAGVTRNDTSNDLRQDRGTGLSRIVDSLLGQDRVTANSQELVVIVTPLLTELEPQSIQERLPAPLSNLGFILSNRDSRTAITHEPRYNAFGAAGFRY
ncbi:type II and III secretion system protein family protein [Roseovarius sp. 217]|uniref:type II and III secretion system protein family protein n=1 Tax=Roseovarius sp. (strain 217) TaxID=314264 RepID=UPI0000685524|nr:pilus assembly protein N-terminal domain-containing protein [Roseovarius sp. 217]EAQ24860.1 type II and III secretion system protein [Roseovarius sp. 217]